MSDKQFIGKRVVITGAAGVIGQWITKAFAKQGASLCISDIRKEELIKLANDPDLAGSDVILHATDLRDPNSINELVELIQVRWRAADIVINNAGIYPSQELIHMTNEEWDEVLDVNLRAPFLLTRELAKVMIQNRIKGSIINMSSGAATTTRIGGGHYSVSKAGLAMLTRAFALELAPYQIRVNAVGPGFAPGSEVSPLSENYIQTMISGIPLGRTSGPDDAPEAILFLCSERASFITGATLPVDGGRSAGNFKLPKSFSEEAGV
ncbi:SDR family oxidoreductase [Fodinisporobacter ferrooxydans]|uniref:SDR family oxidoreductase n=1 Tax=Fodinisporobacter ferrooxydans TaxID=2901836 RepID=A0ABY4CEQ2_9BACL|nr:SDR family oxidoreductase [Alicyclobacillaceae bacterium MYW30-H2]